MSDAHEHPNPNPMDDPAASPLVLGTILGVILTLVTIVATAALYFERERKYEGRAMASSSASVAARVHAAQKTQLASGVRWVDKEKQVVGVPIDLAMQLVAREYGGAAASTPVKP